MPAACAGPAHAAASAEPSLAEVLQAALPAYGREHVLLPDQWKVIRAITACRTAALGAHGYQCEACGRSHLVLHSCRNRHCPLCQKRQAAQWLERQEETLLPVPYFHLVFTLPHGLNPLVRQNRKALYNLLFAAASETLLQFGERRLGGRIGVTAVLHTWSQNLNDHYHLHCLVTGGAFAPEQDRWIGAAPHYLFPVRALAKVFRAKFLQALEQSAPELEYHGQLEPLRQPEAFARLRRQLARTAWVVYAKRPFAGPETVLRYLSRYTHRVALTPRRLLRLDRAAGTVTFAYKDYADGGARKEMTMRCAEFLRRFLLHLLPKGFVKIRHFGVLAGRGRTARLEKLRCLIPPKTTACPAPAPSFPALLAALRCQAEAGLPRCPYCHSTKLRLIQILRPDRRSGGMPKLDSS